MANAMENVLYGVMGVAAAFIGIGVIDGIVADQTYSIIGSSTIDGFATLAALALLVVGLYAAVKKL